MGAATDGDQSFEAGRVSFAGEELPGVGPPLVDDRRGLAPDELRPAGAEPFVAAERQLVGRPVERPVAPFHRVDGEPVADPASPELTRRPQGSQIRLEPNPQTPRAGILLERVRRLVFEVSRHAIPPLSKSCRAPRGAGTSCGTCNPNGDILTDRGECAEPDRGVDGF
jgi:hypothetical protein